MSSESEFWADEAARRVAENGRSPVVKGGVSPSGVPHVGNFNEVLRGAFVARALERREDIGEEPKQVFTSDDRDPLRRVPDTVLSPEGELVELDEEERAELSEHLGKPYVDVPSPFADVAGAPDSWAEHFASFLRADAERLDVPVEFVSNDEMYSSGDFDEPVRAALSNLDVSREVIARHQRTAGADYAPFMPICADCGRITPTPISVDLEDETVDYVCDDADLGGETVEGCGHSGTATFREGKLPWRFEWPAQWWTLGVGFEPFGKDHAEGSWESGVEIAEEVYEIEPPEPLVYEFFLVDGDKMSASAGNVYTVSDILGYVEPSVLRYFFALNPKKQRDLSLADIQHLVNDFDRVEDAYYGREEPADATERLFAERVYEDLRSSEPEDHEPVRPPYTFAAMVGVASSDEARLATLRRSGHLPDDATEAQKQDALRRVELARNWALDFDNEYAVRVLDDAPDEDFDEDTRAAFEDLADVVESGASPDEIQNAVFETAREHDLGVGEFFSDGYTLFLGQDSGPKLGPLLGALDRDFVVERLREASSDR